MLINANVTYRVERVVFNVKRHDSDKLQGTVQRSDGSSYHLAANCQKELESNN